MILYTDVSNPAVTLAVVGQTKIVKMQFASQRISESLLPNIQKLLKINKLSLNNLKKIVVVTGPGPFSRMRTAVVTANALAYALNIPVIGINVLQIPKNLRDLNRISGTKQVLPFYERPPNITKSKKR